MIAIQISARLRAWTQWFEESLKWSNWWAKKVQSTHSPSLARPSLSLRVFVSLQALCLLSVWFPSLVAFYVDLAEVNIAVGFMPRGRQHLQHLVLSKICLPKASSCHVAVVPSSIRNSSLDLIASLVIRARRTRPVGIKNTCCNERAKHHQSFCSCAWRVHLGKCFFSCFSSFSLSLLSLLNA